jgi:hypothetical protein
MHVSGNYPRLTIGLSVLLLSCAASASTQQLEADLRERLAGEHSRLAVSRIYQDEAPQRYIAEDLEITHANGDVLTIERYSVEGPYEQPEKVTMNGIAVSEPGATGPLLSIGSLSLPEPRHAVLAESDLDLSEGSFKAITASEISLRLEGDAADELVKELGSSPLAGLMHIETLTLEELSSGGLGLLDMHGLSAEFTDLETGIAAELMLANLRIEQLTGLDYPGEERIEHAELNGFSLAGDHWSVLLDKLWVDGSAYIGAAGFEGAHFDIAELITLVPPAEREDLQSVSNILTGGSGQLSAEGHSHSRWEEDEALNRLVSEGVLTLSGAAEIAYTMNLPITLPPGVTVQQATQHPELFESATLHGGEVMVAYKDEGMLPRLTTEVAAREGMTNEQVIAQAWAQAQQLGPLLGPQITKLLSGLVDIMGANVQQLTVKVALPNPFTLNQFMINPLESTERLRVNFELK